MAKKQKSRKKKILSAAPLKVTILADAGSDTPAYYVNYASVTHSEYEFVLSAIRVPNPLTREQTELAGQGKPILIEPEVQLIFPPRLIDGLIDALNKQREKYEQNNGPIRSKKEKKG